MCGYFCFLLDTKRHKTSIMVNPRDDAGGLSREYIIRIPSVS